METPARPGHARGRRGRSRTCPLVADRIGARASGAHPRTGDPRREATSTAVVESFTLLTDPFEPLRVLPADNGIYFAICSARARCPYPARSTAWPTVAFLPRRQALELALRTLLETSVSIVVVALPTAQPVWVIFERDDLLANIDAPAVLDQLARPPAVINRPLRDLVGQLTRPRLFLPIPILPPPDDTIYAVSLFGP